MRDEPGLNELSVNADGEAEGRGQAGGVRAWRERRRRKAVARRERQGDAGKAWEEGSQEKWKLAGEFPPPPPRV